MSAVFLLSEVSVQFKLYPKCVCMWWWWVGELYGCAPILYVCIYAFQCVCACQCGYLCVTGSQCLCAHLSDTETNRVKGECERTTLHLIKLSAKVCCDVTMNIHMSQRLLAPRGEALTIISQTNKNLTQREHAKPCPSCQLDNWQHQLTRWM